MAYTSLIKSRIDSKSFLRYDMKIESYNTIRSYVYNLLKDMQPEDRPYLIIFDKYSKDDSDGYFQVYIIFEELSFHEIIENYVSNNSNPYTELVVMTGHKVDEASLMNIFDAVKDEIVFLQRQFEGTDDTYLTIQITR